MNTQHVNTMTDQELSTLEDELLIVVDREARMGFYNTILGAYPSQRQLETVQRERLRRALAELDRINAAAGR